MNRNTPIFNPMRLFTFLTLMTGCSLVWASEPVAMVTEFTGEIQVSNAPEPVIDFGSDIYAGSVLKLGKGASLVLTFYNGCRQEWLGENSVVEVGEAESKFKQGKLVKAEAFECEIPEVQLAQADSHLKAGYTVRGGEEEEKGLSDAELKDKLASGQGPDFLSKPGFKLKLWVNKNKKPVYKLGENIIVHLVSEKDSYIIVDYYTSDGNVIHLSDESLINTQPVKAGKVYTFGTSTSDPELISEPPFGTQTIKVLASSKPFDKQFAFEDEFEEGADYLPRVKQTVAAASGQALSESSVNIVTIP